MRIELHEGQRSVDCSSSPELRQRYGVIATEDYRGYPGAVYRFQALLYPPVTLLDVAGDDGYVAVVYDREVLEYDDVLGRVVGPEQVRGAPYALRAEAGADPEGRAGVEGRPDYSHVGVLQILDVR